MRVDGGVVEVEGSDVEGRGEPLLKEVHLMPIPLMRVQVDDQHPRTLRMARVDVNDGQSDVGVDAEPSPPVS